MGSIIPFTSQPLVHPTVHTSILSEAPSLGESLDHHRTSKIAEERRSSEQNKHDDNEKTFYDGSQESLSPTSLSPLADTNRAYSIEAMKYMTSTNNKSHRSRISSGQKFFSSGKLLATNTSTLVSIPSYVPKNKTRFNLLDIHTSIPRLKASIIQSKLPNMMQNISPSLSTKNESLLADQLSNLSKTSKSFSQTKTVLRKDDVDQIFSATTPLKLLNSSGITSYGPRIILTEKTLTTNILKPVYTSNHVIKYERKIPSSILRNTKPSLKANVASPATKKVSTRKIQNSIQHLVPSNDSNLPKASINPYLTVASAHIPTKRSPILLNQSITSRQTYHSQTRPSNINVKDITKSTTLSLPPSSESNLDFPENTLSLSMSYTIQNKNRIDDLTEKVKEKKYNEQNKGKKSKRRKSPKNQFLI